MPGYPHSLQLESNLATPPGLRLRSWRHCVDGTTAPAAAAHAGLELAWATEGEVDYRIGRRSFSIRPGEAVLIPEGVEHGTRFVGPSRATACLLDSRCIAAVADAMGDRSVPREPEIIGDGAQLATLGRLLQLELAEPRAARGMMLESLSEALIIALLRCPAAEGAEGHAGRSASIRRALEYLEAHSADGELSVERLARAAGLSRYHFSRRFRQELGQPPSAYLLALRLADAAARLRRGERVGEAALAAGFGHLGRFAKAFHQRFGVAPSTYRHERPSILVGPL